MRSAVLLMRRFVACRVYIALWRVLWAFLGVSWPSVAIGSRCCFRRSVRRLYGPRVLQNIYQLPQLPCIIGAFCGRLRAFRASAGICSGFP